MKYLIVIGKLLARLDLLLDNQGHHHLPSYRPACVQYMYSMRGHVMPRERKRRKEEERKGEGRKGEGRQGKGGNARGKRKKEAETQL